jgi:hypothetical protein
MAVILLVIVRGGHRMRDLTRINVGEVECIPLNFRCGGRSHGTGGRRPS